MHAAPMLKIYLFPMHKIFSCPSIYEIKNYAINENIVFRDIVEDENMAKILRRRLFA